MSFCKLHRKFILALILAGLPGSAFAVDGVVLIDQNRALAGSVTAGDTPGFPISITQPGSYRLSGNLTAPANTSAINITANNVALDLNGFTVTANIVDVGIFGLVNTILIGGTDVSIKNGSVILNGSTFMGQGGNAIVSFFGGPATRITLRDLTVHAAVDIHNTAVSLPTAAILQSNFITWSTIVGKFSVVQNNSFFPFQNASIFSLTVVACPAVISGNTFVAGGIAFQGPSATCSQSNNAFQ